MARLVLVAATPQNRIGRVSLLPHQAEAISRIELAFSEFGGALLCDAVGSGKTYIGLAIAKHATHPLVVAPAALREMWMTAMKVAQCEAGFNSIEALSRGLPAFEEYDALVIDEAHHFRNANTNRYRTLTRLAQNKVVLLMTATPVHNSRRDFENLCAVFLGERARHLSPEEVARLVIRRERSRVRVRMPEVTSTEWLEVGDDPGIVDALLRLPPPVPLRDAGQAEALAGFGLVRQWASSEAALIAAIGRRRARAAALESALEAGEHPSANEIRSWIAGDDAIQLQLPDLFAASRQDNDGSLLAAVRAHSAALTSFCRRPPVKRVLDEKRARLLHDIRLAHPSARIVAFASYEATVNALFDRLLHSDRVACLTSLGARVAGGRITRAEAINQFDPASAAPRGSERIDLLLTTDLLSEGVNLQNASVVVHLDMPWTAARLEQRVGRAARAGSRHASVAVFGFTPPASAERALRATELVHAKWTLALSSIGTDADPGLGAPSKTAPASPEIHEATRSRLAAWRRESAALHRLPLVAAAESDSEGFLAVLGDGSRCFLLCGGGGGSIDPSDVHDVTKRAEGRDTAIPRNAYASAVAAIERWISNALSTDIAGLTEARFLRARRIVFAQINSAVEAAAPHQRFVRGQMMDSVRTLAAATLGAEEEKALRAFTSRAVGAPLPESVNNLGFARRSELTTHREPARYTVRALLLLVPTPPLSS